MSARTAKANLADSVKQLQLRWQQIKPLWDDHARRTFEKDVLDPLPARVEAAVKAMGHVVELMARAKHECSDVMEQ